MGLHITRIDYGNTDRGAQTATITFRLDYPDVETFHVEVSVMASEDATADAERARVILHGVALRVLEETRRP